MHSGITGKELLKIGEKPSTAGWFVCEGEGILLAHEDGCWSAVTQLGAMAHISLLASIGILMML